ncbi:nuclear transport factor 2 family protein [Lutimaribacter marinistellae]|uniref:Nuclear transport factor 2 family protein n=1 Tax=Lutimaribacter marinistellae TaxID=1820329 RepID=A0ABV7TAJ7_9RHOB
MDKVALVKRYFDLLTASDIDGIVRLFEVDAIVTSPFLGNMAVPEFFQKLADASTASRPTVFDVLLGEAGHSAAAHFEYDWTLNNGERIVFRGIDYFTFGGNDKFASMSIFYDTHPIREGVGHKYA